MDIRCMIYIYIYIKVYIYIYIYHNIYCKYNAGQVLPHIGHTCGPARENTSIISRCLGSSNKRPHSKGKGRCALALGDCTSSRTSKSRSTTISAPNLRLSVVRSTLGRTVVLQPTAQELLPHNLQPNLALQSLTGG